MAFDVMTLTVKGTELLAAATTADKLVIAGCDATTTFIQQSDAVNVENRPVSPLSTTTDTYLEKSTNNHVFIRVFFVAGQSTGGDARSLYVFGHKESDPTNNYVLGVLSSQDSFHLPEEGDISNTYGALLDIIYSPADGSVSTATTSVYATYGEFADLRDRAVTTHKRDLPTTGDDQTIYGVKTFVDKIKTLSNTWVYQGNTDYECKIAGENDGIQGIKKVGVYSDIIDNNTNINLASFEEKIVTDSNTLKNAGTLELKVSDEDFSKSAQIALNTSYYSGDATSSADVSAENISIKATNEILLASESYSTIISSGNLSYPFNNPPFAEIDTIYNSTANVAYIKFNICDSSHNNYTIFLRKDSENTRGYLYPDQTYVDLGRIDKKWDNVYANTFHGSLDGTASTATNATNATNAINATNATNDANGVAITSYVKSVTQSASEDVVWSVNDGSGNHSPIIDLGEMTAKAALGKASSSSGSYFGRIGSIGLFSYNEVGASSYPVLHFIGDYISGENLCPACITPDDTNHIQVDTSRRMNGSWQLLSYLYQSSADSRCIVLAVKTYVP